MNEYKDPSDVGVLLEGYDFSNHKPNGDVFTIKRPVYTQQEFDLNHGMNCVKKSWKGRFVRKFRKYKQSNCSKEGMKSFFHNKFPFAKIMLKYKWKEWFLADIITGLIIGIMHIPQSIAYAHLAGLRPIYGLYVSFFPVIVYFFFGTSRHVSIGPIAIISLLTGKFLEKSLLDFPLFTNVTNVPRNMSVSYDMDEENESIKASKAAGFTFVIGLVQLIMGIFNFGFVTKYLSDPLISGFTVGASMHVFTSQAKYIFGLNIPKQFGAFNILKTYYHIFKNILKTNVPTFVLTVICIIMLTVTKELINPRVVKKIRIPIPMELIVVIFGTITSKYLQLNEKYNVRCVGKIAQGLPPPTLPDINNLANYSADILITAIIAFSVGVSLAKMFGKKHGYEIDSNQEMIAYGMTNFVSSFFLCYPAATSLSRSAVQDSVGGKTQITSLVSSSLLLIVLLFIGPVFRTLPNCILSAIIIVALKGMFMQFSELKDLWLFSYWDFATWIIAFFGTVFIDVEYGLMIGIGFSILMIMLRTQNPKCYVLGQIKGTDIYKNIEIYDYCEQIEGIKIFRYEGSLYYACSDHFRTNLYSKISCNPRLIHLRILKLEHKLRQMKKKINSEVENAPFIEKQNRLQKELENLKNKQIYHVIIDCSTWGYIDYVGVQTLNQVIEEYRNIDIVVLLANPKTDVRKTIFRSGFSNVSDESIIYVSIHDAVLYSLHNQKMNNINYVTSEKSPI